MQALALFWSYLLTVDSRSTAFFVQKRSARYTQGRFLLTKEKYPGIVLSLCSLVRYEEHSSFILQVCRATNPYELACSFNLLFNSHSFPRPFGSDPDLYAIKTERHLPALPPHGLGSCYTVLSRSSSTSSMGKGSVGGIGGGPSVLFMCELR